MSRPARILVVDDELSILKVLVKRLEIDGTAVSVAMDGEEAIRKTLEEQPDLIVLDLMLPKKNGFEVCTLLKHNPASQHIPIIVLSAKTQEEDARRALACGADAYFKKPFRALELIEHIRKLLPQVPEAPASS